MNKFTQHIPSFVDTDKRLIIEFETPEELFNHQYFQLVTKYSKFSHFAIHNRYLMEISDEGFHWWVLGMVDKPEELNLPQWDGWKFRALLDGEEVVLSKEVTSSCGDRLELRDGRVATNLRK